MWKLESKLWALWSVKKRRSPFLLLLLLLLLLVLDTSGASTQSNGDLSVRPAVAGTVGLLSKHLQAKTIITL